MLIKILISQEPVSPRSKRHTHSGFVHSPTTRSRVPALFFSDVFCILALLTLIVPCSTNAMQDAVCGPIFSTPEQTLNTGVSLNTAQPLTQGSPSIPRMTLTDETGSSKTLIDPNTDALSILGTDEQRAVTELEADIASLEKIANLTVTDLVNLCTTSQRRRTNNALIGVGTFASTTALAWALRANRPTAPAYRSRTSDKSIVSHVLHFIVDQFGYVAGIGTGVVGSVAYYKLKAYFVDPLENEYRQQVAELTNKLETYEKTSKMRLDDHKRKIAAQQKEHEQDVSDTLEKHERKTTAQLADHKHAMATELKEFEQETTKRQEAQEKKLTKQLAEHKEHIEQTTEQARRNALEALLTTEKLEKRVGKTKEKDDSTARVT
ncbi:hypothetical protein CVU75_02945, partial [Candidatus Dependentiae bacterium HGW-Dependentiae-1]